MSDTFTQEEVNKMIGERVSREREKFADYEALKAKASEADKIKAEYEQRLNSMNQAITERENTIKELQTKNTEYASAAVKMRVCGEYGLPLNMSDRLRGENEEEIRKDAESLRGFFARPVEVPKKDGDTMRNDANAELRSMLKGMRGE